MQKLADLDLYDLRWNEPGFAADPYPWFAEARKKHPWIARTDSGYVVFEYNAIRDLMLMDDKMRASFDGIVEIMGAKNTPWGRFTEEQMLALPAREHRVLRDTFAARFTPRFANGVRPLMRETLNRLIDEWAADGSMDFEEFSSYYPVSVMAQLIGAPLSAIPDLRKSLETMGLAFSLNPDLVPALQEAVVHIDSFCQGLIDDRRNNPKGEGGEPDLLDILLDASREGGISDRQLTDLLIFLFVAGYDTSKNVFTYLMHLLTSHPEIYQRCAEDIDYCRKAVEEGLRYFNPSSSFRFTDADIEYRGVLLPKDTMLFFTLNMSGRDPTVFEEADRFDPERPVDPKRRQIAFGLGKHMCLGQYIARAQLQEGLHLVAQRIQQPKVAGEIGWRPFPGIWGLKGLPLEFTPA
ncbi:MAG: cytochrome P450 [Sphingomonadales bacterium]|nr:cytochrome P450 [Sphingomonadales bacterium]